MKDVDIIHRSAMDCLMIPVGTGIQFENLKAHMCNEIDRLFKEWSDKKNVEIGKMLEKIRSDYDEDFKSVTKNRNLAIKNQERHMRQVEKYLAGFNQILKR